MYTDTNNARQPPEDNLYLGAPEAGMRRSAGWPDGDRHAPADRRPDGPYAFDAAGLRRVELSVPVELLPALDDLVLLRPGHAGSEATYRLRYDGVRASLLQASACRAVQAAPSIDRLCLAFGITQAEAKVLAALVDGALPKRYALQHGISVSTVRTQIAALMRKMECCRQVDLVRKVWSAGLAGGADFA